MPAARTKGNATPVKDAEKNLRGPSMYVRLNTRESDALKSIAGKTAIDLDARTVKRLVGLGLIRPGLASDGTSRLTREGLEWIGAHTGLPA